jgi:ketosteroid isomerase-like protein
MGNRRIVERWVAALEADDLAAQRELLHPDFVGRYPQSGEVIRGPDNRIAIAENYPERERFRLAVHVDAITGTDDAYVTTPAAFAWSVVHLSGTDDEFTVTGTVLYPDGVNWHALALLVVRDGRIWRETSYYAEPFPAPAWRAQWVERDVEAASTS